MSIAVKTINILGEYYIDVSRPDLEQELQRIGFKRANDGKWIPPEKFSFDYDHERELLPSDIEKWNERYFSEFIELNGTRKQLLKITYDESISARDRTYELKKTSIYYPEYYLPKDKKAYEVFLETEIKTFEDWLNFPIKAILGQPLWEHTLSLEKHNYTKSFIKSALKEIADPNSEFKDDIKGFLETLAGVRYFSSQKHTNEWGDISELFDFGNWGQFIIYELFEESRRNIRILLCKACGRPINVKKPGHQDRQYHTEDEDIDCWKQRERERKRLQRLK